jgi:hypothetical protein
METQDGHFEHFIYSSGGRNSETMLQKICVNIIFFLLHGGLDSPSVGLALHFFLRSVYVDL